MNDDAPSLLDQLAAWVRADDFTMVLLQAVRTAAEAPYLSVARAMQGWPETATAVGVRLTQKDRLEWVFPWGLQDLFDLKLKLSPLCRHPETFAQRVRDKEWLHLWPRLSVEPTSLSAKQKLPQVRTEPVSSFSHVIRTSEASRRALR